MCKYLVEMIKVGWIRDSFDNPIETYENRHLYEERETRTKWIHSFFFIEFHHFLSEFCLIVFMGFLELLDLWLYDLHLLLTLEHMLLWNEEDQANNHCDDEYCPSERVTRDPSEDRYEEIVYRLIDECREC